VVRRGHAAARRRNPRVWSCVLRRLTAACRSTPTLGLIIHVGVESMIELPSEELASANALLVDGCVGAEIVGAVLAGHTNGKVFVRDLTDVRTAFVYDSGFCVLAGAVADVEFASKCLNWLYSHAEQDFFILYPGHECWVQVLDAVATSSMKKVGRIAYRLDEPSFGARSSRPSLSGEFTLARMDAALMRAAADTLYPWARGTWKSEAHFERHGLGFCVLRGERIVSLCYSVFVSGRHHEIDILTAGPLRRLGLARDAASAYIQECLKRGLHPGWNCFTENRASRELAADLGFVPASEFPVYAWQRIRSGGDEA
jgi:RimJ/RimL family protein N-acetyltransferase